MLHGESGSAEAGDDVDIVMAYIQQVLREFKDEDIYHMDETGLY